MRHGLQLSVAGWLTVCACMLATACADDATGLKILASAQDSTRAASIGPVQLDGVGGVVIRSAEALVGFSSKAASAKDAVVQKEIETELARLLHRDGIDWTRQMVLLELGGLATEQFRKFAEGSTDFGAGGPPTPVVDLVLEVRNTSNKPIQLFTMPDLAKIVLELSGPDALTIRHEGPIDLDRRLPKPVTLQPGQVFTRPIRNFDHGDRDLEFRSFWIAPGEYTLTAEFQTAILPAPPGALVYGGGLGEPPLKGFGEVTVTTTPLKLKVTDGKEDKKQGQIIRPTKNLMTGYIDGEDEVKLSPPNGFITKKEDFEKLWKVWLLDDKVPAVDFKTHLVVVATSREGPIKTAALFDETKAGDMRIRVELERKTKNDGKGITVLIAVFPRAGIMSIEGRAIAAP